MLLHTSISTSSSHSSLSLLFVIYVTPHIHSNILISFASVLASCHLCYSTHTSQHPHFIHLYPCFLSFMLLHTSISTSSAHSSLSLLLVVYVTPHIHLNILVSFVSILASCHLCYSTHPSQHPRLIRLYPCFLSCQTPRLSTHILDKPPTPDLTTTYPRRQVYSCRHVVEAEILV